MWTGWADLLRSARRGLTLSLAVASLLAPLSWAACDTRRPGGYRPTTRVPTLPIARAERERPNKITYYLASMTQKDEQVIIDLDLLNGMARGFQSVTVWVTLLGTQGEKQRVSYILGPMGPHAQDHVIVKADGITFAVDDLEVGLQLQ